MSGDGGSPTIAVGTYPCTCKGARYLWWGFELPRLDVDPAERQYLTSQALEQVVINLPALQPFQSTTLLVSCSIIF